MLNWLDVLKYATNGNLKPDRRVEKTDQEWEILLSSETYKITRQKGTERAHSSEMCNLFEPGRYSCVCCGTALFDSEAKFESGTGWPSFAQPIKRNVIAYHKDKGFGMYRIETVCNVCDAHLGHVFQDGPPPSGLRYCMNALALKKIETNIRKTTIGGGCFWCTEAIFQELNGVIKVESGYSGGKSRNSTYREVASGYTGHAEVVEVTYDQSIISYKDLLKIHMTTHDPTTINQQGADKGSQYRSIIFYRNDEEREVAMQVIREVQTALEEMIVTELKMFEAFYGAESYHQEYYKNNPNKAYCQAVIHPKLEKFRTLYKEKLKQKQSTKKKPVKKIPVESTKQRLSLNQIELGKPLPEWSIEAIFGEEKIPVVQDYIGKPLVLLFFSLGCPGCKGRAVPYANRLVFEKSDEINVIGIHTNFEGIDFTQEHFGKAREELYIRFPFYKDLNYDTTFLNFGAGGTPHWIITDKNGNVVYSIFGSAPNNALLRLDLKINELLNPSLSS